MEKQVLTLGILLENPPAGVDFGLQKGSGAVYETVQKHRSTGQDLYFELEALVKDGKDTLPDFFGPFVQGPANARFIYIDIGAAAGQADSIWSRRLKIPLSGISKETLQLLSADPQKKLQARVAGTGKDGGPTCGTVKPFDGWKIVKSA